MKSIWPTVARAHAYTLLQIPALNVSVCSTTFTFLRHLSVISEQTKSYEVLSNLYNLLKDKVSFYFMTPVQNVAIMDNGDYEIITENEKYTCEKCIISVGRSGSKWMEQSAITLKFQQFKPC